MSQKEITKKLIFEHSLVLLEFRNKFNLDKFKKLDSEEQRYKYVVNTLGLGDSKEPIGSGSARIVFPLSNRFVLKIPKKGKLDKAQKQNKNEVEVFQSSNNKNIVTKIYDFADDFSWVISELVRPLSYKPKDKSAESEFEKLSGISWDTYSKIMDKIAYGEKHEEFAKGQIAKYEDLLKNEIDVESNRKKVKEYSTYTNNEFMKQIIDFVTNSNVEPLDLMRIDHFGKNSNGELIILDYGI